MKLWLALALLLVPFVALADPFTIASLAVAGLQAAGYITALQAFVVGVGIAVFGAVEARRKQRAAQSAARAAYNASLQDRSVTTLRANPPWQVIYGRCVVGGSIVGIFTSDNTTAKRTDGSTYTKPDAYKHLVIALAAHECQAINDVYIDGVALGTLDADGWVTSGEFFGTEYKHYEVELAPGAAITETAAPTVNGAWDATLSTLTGDGSALVPGTYSTSGDGKTIRNEGTGFLRVAYTMATTPPTVRVLKHLGSSTQEADAVLKALVPGEWTDADRLRGHCYVIVTLDLTNQRFQGGPPNITFDVSGKKLYDPRTGATAWSSNPALAIRDFLTGEYGFNCLSADVDDAYVSAAANACDSPVNLTVGAIATPGVPTYKCDGAFNTDQSKEQVLQDLAEGMAGTVTYGAKWLVQAGVWTVPVMTLTDDDLHGQLEVIQGGAGMDETFNTVRGQYIPAGSAVPADFDVYSNATFVSADGQALYADFAFPFVDNKARCRNLARIFVERNRDGLVIRYPAKLRAWPLQIGDRVYVTSTEYGWTLKTFRVTDWQFDLTSPVVLTLQEDAAAVYDLADAATSDPAANTLLPNPWVVTPPSGVTITSGAAAGLNDATLGSRVKIEWTAPTDAYLADGSGYMLIRWRRQLRDTTNVWQVLPPVPAGEARAFIRGVMANDTLTIELRFRNGLGALSSPVYYAHTVSDNASQARTVQLITNAVSSKGQASISGSSLTVTSGIVTAQNVEISAATITKTAGTSLRVTVSGNIQATFKGSGFASGTKKMLAQVVLVVRDGADAVAFTPQTENTWVREEPIHVELSAAYTVPFAFSTDYANVAASGSMHVSLTNTYFGVSNTLTTFSAIDAVSSATVTATATIEELKR